MFLFLLVSIAETRGSPYIKIFIPGDHPENRASSSRSWLGFATWLCHFQVLGGSSSKCPRRQVWLVGNLAIRSVAVDSLSENWLQLVAFGCRKLFFWHHTVMFWCTEECPNPIWSMPLSSTMEWHKGFRQCCSVMFRMVVVSSVRTRLRSSACISTLHRSSMISSLVSGSST